MNGDPITIDAGEVAYLEIPHGLTELPLEVSCKQCWRMYHITMPIQGGDVSFACGCGARIEFEMKRLHMGPPGHA